MHNTSSVLVAKLTHYKIQTNLTLEHNLFKCHKTHLIEFDIMELSLYSFFKTIETDNLFA